MKLPSVAHSCGEPLSFETRDGISYERCARCRYEAPVPRRAPSAKEETARRRMLKGKERKRPCRGGCGNEATRDYGQFCDACRATRYRDTGRQAHA